jgi:hypothetical protein
MLFLIREGATTVSDVTTALSTALGTIATNALSAIAAIVPVAAPILGAVAIIGIGIKVFKKIRG